MSQAEDRNPAAGAPVERPVRPMPEPPAFYRYQYQSHYGIVWRSSAENWNGCPPIASEGLYSADQVRAYAAQEVAAERERIAKHFDDRDKGTGGFYEPHEPAEIIRALKA